MLRALLHSKDLGTQTIRVEGKLSWRQIFKASEDFLTASVFSRLCYLDGPELWELLREASGHALPSYKLATLQNVEFWPRWSLSSRDFVEPDIFLQFSLGDPEVLVDVLVEAKLGAGLSQYCDQWIAEIEAYTEQFPDNDRHQFYFLAVGGLGSNIKRRTEYLAARTIEAVGHANISGTSWSKLTDVVHAHAHRKGQKSRILDDILEALALCGERHIDALSTLKSVDRDWSLDQIKLLKVA